MEISLIRSVLGENNINISEDAKEKLCRLAELLIEFNSHTNLTAIKTDEGIALDHFADSLLGLDMIPEGARLIDVGAGGGFPSLPIAIARPDVTVVSLDSTAKKLKFIDRAASELGLGNITTLAARAEDAVKDKNMREKFDVATARAVSRLNILSELCLPFISLGGKFLSYKGREGATEYDEASKGIAVLGGKLTEMREFNLSYGELSRQRFIISIEKSRKTPDAYPRAYNKILKKPL